MDQLEPLYDKKFECLYCTKPFTSKKVRSRFIKINGYDTDFFPLYESDESNPLFYHTQVCPSCGFSFSDDFSKFFSPESRDVIQQKVTSRWVPQDFGTKRSVQQAIQTYQLALFCGSLKDEKHIVLAGISIRIAWLYRSIKNTAQEQRFIKLALKEYEDSYFNTDYRGTQMSEAKLLYLIGELSRRLNENEKAVQYFSKVIEQQRQYMEPTIVEMAKERWYEIRDSKQ